VNDLSTALLALVVWIGVVALLYVDADRRYGEQPWRWTLAYVLFAPAGVLLYLVYRAGHAPLPTPSRDDWDHPPADMLTPADIGGEGFMTADGLWEWDGRRWRATKRRHRYDHLYS
jgi:hypothetical protein